MSTQPSTPRWPSALLHEPVCLACGHGSSLHRSGRRGECLVCEQVKSLWHRRLSRCAGYAPDA